MFRSRPIPVAEPRRGMILLVVLLMLLLFAILGLSLVFYADAEATAARAYRDAQAKGTADIDPEALLAYFLGQLIYDVPDDERGVWSGLRGHSLARNMFGLNYELAPDGTLRLRNNDVPFNGVGRLSLPSPFPGRDDQDLINYTYHPADGFLRDPERLNWINNQPARTGLGQPRGPFAGGVNAPYTYPDLNNLFLAALKADGTLLLPSFHRPWLFGTLRPTNPNWTNSEGKYLILRPRPIDMGPGFPYPEDEGGDVKNLIGAPGGNDSIWIDLDAPVCRAPDGRKYKPLFAALILDLDNRVNLNVHGNLRGPGFAGHASNQGWGPWEVNLGRVLTNTPAEWPHLLAGRGLGGRYGLSTQPHSPLPNNTFVFPGQPRFYAPVDFDGAQAGGAPSSQLSLPGALPALPCDCFPAAVSGYGNGSAGEGQGHPALYNPIRPMPPDRLLSLANMEALLRYRDTGSQAFAADLFRLCPHTFTDRSDPEGAAKRRRLVTLRSFDVDRPGITPWFWPSGPALYNRLPPPWPLPQLSPHPSAGFPPRPSGPPNHPDSEWGPDGRAAAWLTALRRLDLNRPLPAYPLGPDGRIADPTGFAVAQTARQQLAADILERLRRLTGTGQPAPPGMPGYEPARWNALRWLAQLAVNIVDFIDPDDCMTPFNWAGGEWVYGTELPRVLLNEAYAEYANAPGDPGLTDPGSPHATLLKCNIWVELYNPFRHDEPVTAPWRNGAAWLAMPPTGPGMNNGYAVYRLVIARLSPYALDPLRAPENVRGELYPPGTGSVLSVVDRFEPVAPPAPVVDTRVILPADAAYDFGFFGPEAGNRGFYVLGPQLGPGEHSPFLPTPDGQPLETLRRPEMSFVIPAANPMRQLLPRPTLLLQRLACPYLPPGPHNPYVTVDFMANVEAHYAAEVSAAVPDGPGPAPLPVEARFSVGRKQPYAGHETQLRRQWPQPPLPGQPQHTFFQHNTDPETTGPNWRRRPAGYPAFDWLVHLDRPLISPIELLHVSAYKPHELTQEFIKPDGKRFNHRAPWLDEDLTGAGLSSPQSHRLYRALEFFCTRPWSLGLMNARTTSAQPVTAGANRTVYPAALGGLTAAGGTWQIEAGSCVLIDHGLPTEEVVRVKAILPPAPEQPAGFIADFLRDHGAGFTITPTAVSERIPGKINLNTVWDKEIFLALCDPQPSNRFNEGTVADMFEKLKMSRTISGDVPGPGDRPFRSLATGPASSGDSQPSETGLQSTLLRSLPGGGPPILAVPAAQHPYQQYELLTKIFNQVTVRSNVFAVWLTVGFFEVTDDTTRPVKLGPELGRAENRHVRHRMFAIVDRSLLLTNPGPQPAFDPRASRSPGAAGPVVPYLSIID
ncbi:MAG TPA: hypothetical protein VNK04_21745 [Gemmataceae bacterium]|nr:hypothetical protein [Gemmataceae bacterium]